MVYVFQMFFSWDRRSQGTFPAVKVGFSLLSSGLAVTHYWDA